MLLDKAIVRRVAWWGRTVVVPAGIRLLLMMMLLLLLLPEELLLLRCRLPWIRWVYVTAATAIIVVVVGGGGMWGWLSDRTFWFGAGSTKDVLVGRRTLVRPATAACAAHDGTAFGVMAATMKVISRSIKTRRSGARTSPLITKRARCPVSAVLDVRKSRQK